MLENAENLADGASKERQGFLDNVNTQKSMWITLRARWTIWIESLVRNSPCTATIIEGKLKNKHEEEDEDPEYRSWNNWQKKN